MLLLPSMPHQVGACTQAAKFAVVVGDIAENNIWSRGWKHVDVELLLHTGGQTC